VKAINILLCSSFLSFELSTSFEKQKRQVLIDKKKKKQGSPLPILLDDEMATLMDVGIGNESTVLVDEES
jgi:hypothetical protein